MRGAQAGQIAQGHSKFGHLALAVVPALAAGADEGELLLILGWNDVHAIARDLSTRWIARDVAVDGLVFGAVDGSLLAVHAEMDPPGGWFAVTLDARDGRELGRQPAFTPGYVGLYGAAEEN